MDKDIICSVYHSSINPHHKLDIIKFIQTHNITNTGNITELSEKSLDRILSLPHLIGILTINNKIIGTIISVIFRVKNMDTEFLTAYTSFLCIHKNYRKQGLAQVLIQSIKKKRPDIQHGYYLTFHPQHTIHNKISSWYRPINIAKIKSANFTLQSFPNDAKQRIYYHVSKPNILPISCSYDRFVMICQKQGLNLVPTEDEFMSLSRCFDIYTVDHSLFMIFPLSSIINGKRISICQIVMIIGNCLSQALWIASEMKYDLLYGYENSDINIERVKNIKGIVTESELYLEFYNSQEPISNINMIVPLF